MNKSKLLNGKELKDKIAFPSAMNLAAIDIGSNGARLLIKHFDVNEPESHRVRRVMYLRVPLRLGKDVFTLNKISKERERMMLHMMKGFKQFMLLNNVIAYRSCATSAMRDAENGRKVLKRIKEETGINLEIIPGQEEAQLLANNLFPIMSEGEYDKDVLPQLGEKVTYAYVDVGGGSTEVSLIHNRLLVESHSYNCGTLRMLSGKVKKDTINVLKTDLAKYSERFDNIRIIGSGGNINKLFKLAHIKGSKRELPLETIQSLYLQMKPLSIEERMEQFCLKEDRADVIIPATEIFLMVAQDLKCSSILVPNISLADSIVDGLYEQITG